MRGDVCLIVKHSDKQRREEEREAELERIRAHKEMEVARLRAAQVGDLEDIFVPT
jgi:hypothetical protein